MVVTPFVRALWKPALVVLLVGAALGGDYIYGHRAGVASQKAVDSKEIAGLNQTIGQQTLQLRTDETSFTALKNIELANKAALTEAAGQVVEARATATAEHKLVAKTRQELDKQFAIDKASAKNARLLSPACELPHDAY